MTRPIITEHNLETNETFEREMNDDEFSSYQSFIKSEQDAIKKEAERIAKKAELLAKLGITEDDAKLLLS